MHACSDTPSFSHLILSYCVEPEKSKIKYDKRKKKAVFSAIIQRLDWKKKEISVSFSGKNTTRSRERNSTKSLNNSLGTNPVKYVWLKVF